MLLKPLRAGALVLAATIAVTLTASAAGAGSLATDLAAPTQTAPVAGTGTAKDPGSPKLMGVRTGRHDRYDRTVFDFTGGTPNYRVGYATLVAGGTGHPVPLTGAASLVAVQPGIRA